MMMLMPMLMMLLMLMKLLLQPITSLMRPFR
jgi:hypothetical protein